MRRPRGSWGRTPPAAHPALSALKLLGHWVGDLHQPLHVAFKDDRGGGKIRGQGTCVGTLHAIWDDCLVPRGDLRETANTLRGAIMEEERAAWTATPHHVWANESLEIARGGPVGYCARVGHACVYAVGNDRYDEGERQRTVLVGVAYVDTHAPIVADRLKRAGVRLAHLLNNTFVPSIAPTGTFPLSGTAWVVDEIDGVAVPRGSRGGSVEFLAAGGVRTYSCNSYVGALEGSDTALRFPLGRGGHTLIGCPFDASMFEAQMHDALFATAAYRRSDDILLLLDDAGRVRMRLRKSPRRSRRRPRPAGNGRDAAQLRGTVCAAGVTGHSEPTVTVDAAYLSAHERIVAERLKQAGVRRMAVVWNPTVPGLARYWPPFNTAATALGMTVSSLAPRRSGSSSSRSWLKLSPD